MNNDSLAIVNRQMLNFHAKWIKKYVKSPLPLFLFTIQ
jgi:hypothetical protein